MLKIIDLITVNSAHAESLGTEEIALTSIKFDL